MRRERLVVEREVRRRNDRDRIGLELGRVGRQCNGVGGRLGSRMDDQRAAQCDAERTGRAAALLEAQQDPLAGRAAGEDAIGAVRLEERHVWRHGLLVELRATIAQRRDGGDDERPVAQIGEHRRDATVISMITVRPIAAGELEWFASLDPKAPTLR